MKTSISNGKKGDWRKREKEEDQYWDSTSYLNAYYIRLICANITLGALKTS
jgi:hypothetical protein